MNYYESVFEFQSQCNDAWFNNSINILSLQINLRKNDKQREERKKRDTKRWITMWYVYFFHSLDFMFARKLPIVFNLLKWYGCWNTQCEKSFISFICISKRGDLFRHFAKLFVFSSFSMARINSFKLRFKWIDFGSINCYKFWISMNLYDLLA